MNSTSHPARQEVLSFRPTSVASRGKEWRGEAREGNKANLSPTSVSAASQSWLRAQTLPHPGSDLGKVGRAREESGSRAVGGAWARAFLPPLSPNLAINLSHLYLFFSQIPLPPPQRTSIIGLPHMRTECRRWVCIFRPFAKKLPEFSAPPTIISKACRNTYFY